MTGPAAALVGGQVVIATSTAARIAPVLRAAADRARCNGLPLDDDLVQLLAVLTAAERQHLRRPPTVAATTLAPDGCAAPSSGQVLDAGEVARRARGPCTRTRTGRLPARWAATWPPSASRALRKLRVPSGPPAATLDPAVVQPAGATSRPGRART